jgi:hypothetical protein
MDGFEVEPNVLRNNGRKISESAQGTQKVQSTLERGVSKGNDGIRSFAIAAALEGYLRQSEAALRSVSTALEDHGAGLVNAHNAYNSADRSAVWMFKRYAAKLEGKE